MFQACFGQTKFVSIDGKLETLCFAETFTIFKFMGKIVYNLFFYYPTQNNHKYQPYPYTRYIEQKLNLAFKIGQNTQIYTGLSEKKKEKNPGIFYQRFFELTSILNDMFLFCYFQGRAHIFKIHAKSMSVDRDIRYELLARLCPNSTGAEIRSVCTEAGMFAIRARRKLATEKDFLEAINKVIKAYAKFSSTPKYMTYNQAHTFVEQQKTISCHVLSQIFGNCSFFRIIYKYIFVITFLK